MSYTLLRTTGIGLLSFGLTARQTMADEPSSLTALVLYVDQLAAPDGDGLGWESAFADLADALEAAVSSAVKPVEIRVAGGIYKPTTIRGVSVPGGVILLGGYAGAGAAQPELRLIEQFETVLSGDILGNDGDGPTTGTGSDNAVPVLRVHGDGLPVVIDGFTITGGFGWGLYDGGGGIFVHETDATIRNCKFFRNCFVYCDAVQRDAAALHSPGGGGAVFASGMDSVHRVAFENCEFELNGSYASGGAVSTLGVSVSITGCRFRDNSAPYGGAVGIWNAEESQIVNSEFVANEAAYGGAVALYDAMAASVEGSSFLTNTASQDGGAIYEEDSSRYPLTSSIEVVGTHFEGNAASRRGGAIATFARGSITVQQGQFAGNSASDGGAIALYGGDALRVSTSGFEGNDATGSGGAIYAYGLDLVVPYERIRFHGNVAGADGGAVYSDYGPGSGFKDCEFEDNRSGRAGGAVFSDHGESTFEACVFRRNSAKSSGGAVSGSTGRPTGFAIDANSCVFVGNIADFGGAVSKNYGFGSMQASTLVGNTARQAGGGVYGAGWTVQNSILWKNWLDTPTGYAETAQSQIWSASGVQISYSNVQGWVRTDQPTVTDADPSFLEPLPLKARKLPSTLQLHPSSPCRDSGDPEYGAEAADGDVAGKPRILCNRIDRGAYEYGIAGDADCDGRVTVSDLMHAIDCVAGPGSSASSVCLGSDANLDGSFDLRDLAWLLPQCSMRPPVESE